MIKKRGVGEREIGDGRVEWGLTERGRGKWEGREGMREGLGVSGGGREKKRGKDVGEGSRIGVRVGVERRVRDGGRGKGETRERERRGEGDTSEGKIKGTGDFSFISFQRKPKEKYSKHITLHVVNSKDIIKYLKQLSLP